MICRLLLFLFFFSFLQASSAQSPGIETSGDILMVALPVTSFASSLLYEEGYQGSWHLIRGVAVNSAVTLALKYGIDRTRPNGGRYSFPSGHTSMAFASASFVHLRYGWKAGLTAYAAASYVGWTRIHAQKHHFTDVMAGAIIGTISSGIFTRRYLSGELQITPTSNFSGLCVLYRL